jgi:predicted sulfurtransferase
MRLALVVGGLLLFALPRVGAAQDGTQMVEAPRISQKDFKRLIAAKTVIIVDTRNADAFRLGHIPGAVLLPLEGQMTWPESYQPTVNRLKASAKRVVTYCA